MYTQTSTQNMNHQTTMTDPFLNSGVHIKEQKDTEKIQRKKKIKKKVQLGTTSVKLTKKNIPILKRISRCHRCKNNKIPNKNEMEKKTSGGYQDEKNQPRSNPSWKNLSILIIVQI
ncbi:hypothetical protein JTB14_012047 [Gonioctena quinquepunctata]|nr:hypothetical protein JTB14_012047 [Gonioctena quinquepunctata]